MLKLNMVSSLKQDIAQEGEIIELTTRQLLLNGGIIRTNREKREHERTSFTFSDKQFAFQNLIFSRTMVHPELVFCSL
jgi:hypothetical protein